MEHFGLTAVVLVECIVLGWFYETKDLQNHLNSVSNIKVGNWWIPLIKVILPLILFYLLVSQFIIEIKNPYGNYPIIAILIAGWLLSGLLPILGFIFSLIRRK